MLGGGTAPLQMSYGLMSYIVVYFCTVLLRQRSTEIFQGDEKIFGCLAPESIQSYLLAVSPLPLKILLTDQKE